MSKKNGLLPPLWPLKINHAAGTRTASPLTGEQLTLRFMDERANPHVLGDNGPD